MRRWERRALLVAVTGTVGAVVRRDGAGAQNRALRSALTGAAFDEVRTLTDPGRSRLLEGLRSFFAAAGPADVLVLALNGGIVKTGEGALYFPAAPEGRRPGHDAVELAAVGAAIREGAARSTVVLLGCHYSGWSDDGPDGRTRTVPRLDIRRVFPADRCVVIADTAADRVHRADGTAVSFALSVADALGGAAPDRDGDGWIDTADLDEYLRSAFDGTGCPPALITGAEPVPLARARVEGAGAPPADPEPPPTPPVESGADADLAAEIEVLTAGLLWECRTARELRDRLRIELPSTGLAPELAAETAAAVELLLVDGDDPDRTEPREFPGRGPDPETEVAAFGAAAAALALRLRRDREADAAHETVRAPAAPPERVEPLDEGRWRLLLAHHREALVRTEVRTHLFDPADPDGWVVLPARRESLISGAADAVAATRAVLRLADAAARCGQALRYGYPMVLERGVSESGDVPSQRAAPLFVMDVEVRPGDDEPVLRALGPPEVNPALVAADAEHEPLRAWWRAQRGKGGVRDLAATTRLVLAHLGIDRVDDIDTRALGGGFDRAGTRPGARNVAVVFRAGAEAVSPLLDDLDDTSDDGLDVARVGETALDCLTGGPGPGAGSAAPVLPVAATALSESHHRVLEAVMNRRLTVVAAPPGTGADALVTAVAHTAVAAGQSVLYAGPDRAAADAFAARAGAEAGVDHLVVRTGGPELLEAEAEFLKGLPHTGGEEDPAGWWAEASRTWAASCVARLAIDAISRTERDLALLADARGRIVAAGWDPEALFRGRRPQDWLRLVERGSGRFGIDRFRRSVVRRRLGALVTPEDLARVCEIARVEAAWRAAVDVWRRTTALEELYGDLEEAAAAHRDTATGYLAAVVERRRAEGYQALAGRLECLNWRSEDFAWPGLEQSLTAVPARAVEVGRARWLPPRAGMFDLVILDAADRCGVAAALPLLYRARRVLAVGDPARRAPARVPAEEAGRGARSDAVPRWIAERALGGPGTSAYRALARAGTEAGGRVLWLDEHDRSHPLLAETADRYGYGGRSAVLTDTRALACADRPVRWHDAVGECEREGWGSFVNREEAYRAVGVLAELDARLPERMELGVASPFFRQRALLRRLVDRRLLREVRIEAPHAFGPRPCDVLVVSPVLSGAGARSPTARDLSGPERWNPVLTAAVGLLAVVGDRGFWRGAGGVLATLADLAEEPPGADPDQALAALAAALRRVSGGVDLAPVVRGHRVDLRVDTPDGPVLVLVDRTGDGRGLRRLLKRLHRLREVTGLPVLRAPVWRCLHAPEALAEEVVLAGGRGSAAGPDGA
ncbi:AAA domain-containing protein [Actinorugispora endophytica]|uniref:DNA2/NAM7 helicase-like C-terminal domain-containing protein n=1 Tax=Actinorugispora endophytica TaxID=1605990 RepID=A0A4R6V4I0_9ACTN|nr:AAA domain-containing protein [Actinorugispora endophytica]TDQ53719.1 hypothetical protein EV190_103170 [Actinorugispora endophytica]